MLERVIQELKYSKHAGRGRNATPKLPEGLWIAQSFHVIEARALGISNKEHEEHGTPLQAQ